MIKLLVRTLVSLAILLPVSAWAACEEYTPGHWYPGSYAAQSLAVADVQSCLANAAFAAGDIIHLKGGTVDWSGGGVTINKQGAVILGAGNALCPANCDDLTTIQVGSTRAFLVSRNDVRISGITFDGPGDGNGSVWVNGGGARTTQNWRIDHNHFKNTTQRGITAGAWDNIAGGGRDMPGLIDHNRFDATARHKAIEVYGHSETAHGAWDDTLDFGGTSFVFIEDNIFTHNTMVLGAAGSIDADMGARMVIRFNQFVNADVYCHGLEQQCFTLDQNVYCPWRSTHGWEVYGNTFHFTVTHDFTMNWRGGTGMVWGNAFTGTAGRYAPVRYLYERGDLARSCGNENACQGNAPQDGNQDGKYGYVCHMQLGTTGSSGIVPKPVYQWANTLNASYGEAALSTITYESACNYQHVQFGRDVIRLATADLGTSLPATCTANDMFWNSNEGTWNKTPGGLQGRLYKCVTDNNWQPIYTPHEYPHPLQSYVYTPPISGGTLTLGGTGTLTPGSGGTLTLGP